MTAPSATELPTAQPNVPANSRHPGPRAVPSVSSVLILPPGPIVDRHRRPQERLQAARRPPAYPNQARIIAPVTPSHPSAVLTPSTCMNRWIRAYESGRYSPVVAASAETHEHSSLHIVHNSYVVINVRVALAKGDTGLACRSPSRDTRFEGTLEVGIANSDGVEVDESPGPSGHWRYPVPEEGYEDSRFLESHPRRHHN